MALDFLFFDDLTGLWSVDEATGIATQLTTQTQATGGLSKGIVVSGGKLWYATHKPAGTSIADTQLWQTDGTAAGTTFVKQLPDVGAAGDNAGIYGIVALSDGSVAVSDYDGASSAVYISTGASGSTFKVAAFSGTTVPFDSPHQVALLSSPPFPDSLRFPNGGFVWSIPVGHVSASKEATLNVTPGIATAGDKIFLGVAPAGSSSFNQLYTEDFNSTETLIATLPDSSNGGGGAAINALTTLASNKVAFAYINGSFSAQSIYLSDGSAIGTVKVTGYTGTAFAGPDQTAELTGSLLFMDGTGLWSVNETTAAATELKSFAGFQSSDMRTVNGKAYFDLSTGGPGAVQLWVTDGTTNGTSLVAALPDNTPVGGVNTPAIFGIAALANGDLAVDYFDGATESVYLTSGAGVTKVTGFSSTAGNGVFYNNSQIGELTVACFARGTHIATDQGPRAVEDLTPGDLLVTPEGPKPLIWLGHREIDCASHPSPGDVLPIRVARDAFGPSMPARDLFLSPDHAVFVEGVLIPVRHLVNGHTITRQQRSTVSYWHAELAEHGVIFAEGLAVESYLDTGDRHGFAGGPVVALHPVFNAGRAHSAREAGLLAPLIVRGPVLDRVRATLRHAGMSRVAVA